MVSVLFFFNDTATTEIYTLSLHDALPICQRRLDLLQHDQVLLDGHARQHGDVLRVRAAVEALQVALLDQQQRLVLLRSEEHTSELQSRQYLVCRLLLEKQTK